jgi:Flp pilus assembly pilin Flp
MDRINAIYVRATEWRRGQTMTEYALIVSAIAVALLAGYKSMGTDLRTLLTSVDSQL